MGRFVACLALVAAAATVCVAAGGPPKIFEPTDEWREVQGDEQIPGGLEVRMDLTAGKKWARNLQPAAAPATAAAPAAVASAAAAVPASSAGGLVVVEQPAEPTPVTAAGRGGRRAGRGGRAAAARRAPAVNEILPADGLPLEAPPATPTPEPTPTPADGLDERHREMQHVLLGLPQPEPELTDAVSSGLPPEQLKALLARLWAQRQAELQEVFASSAKTEGQLMQGLIQRLLGVETAAAGMDAEAATVGDNATAAAATATAADPDGSRISLLRDLEFHVATLHNAHDFNTMGGLTAVGALLNDSSLPVALHAAWVLGTAVKYAAPLQDAALAQGALPRLLQLLERSLDEHAAAVHAGGVYRVAVAGGDGSGGGPVEVVYDDVPLAAASKALYALGGLLRSSGPAQRQFVALQGPALFVRTLRMCVAGIRGGGSGGSGSDNTEAAAVTGAGGVPAASNPLLRPSRAIAGRLLTLLADLHAEHEAAAAEAAAASAAVGGAAAGDPQAFRDGTTRIVLRQQKEDGDADAGRRELQPPHPAEDGGVNASGTTVMVEPPRPAVPVAAEAGVPATTTDPHRRLTTLVGPAADPAGGPGKVCAAAGEAVAVLTGAPNQWSGSSVAASSGGSDGGTAAAHVAAAVTGAVHSAWEVLEAPCAASGSSHQ